MRRPKGGRGLPLARHLGQRKLQAPGLELALTVVVVLLLLQAGEMQPLALLLQGPEAALPQPPPLGPVWLTAADAPAVALPVHRHWQQVRLLAPVLQQPGPAGLQARTTRGLSCGAGRGKQVLSRRLGAAEVGLQLQAGLAARANLDNPRWSGCQATVRRNQLMPASGLLMAPRTIWQPWRSASGLAAVLPPLQVLQKLCSEALARWSFCSQHRSPAASELCTYSSQKYGFTALEGLAWLCGGALGVPGRLL